MINYFENEEEDNPNKQKLLDMILYRDLTRELPLYEAFIKEKPKLILET